ncbi:NACHT domain-containing protein, partial [Nonomuraea basaltis]|uniref:NACHT domain-containing protein n=1 Tax=Nonomuraea basaltis TaxID=2495887 RepID=UPI00110C5606
MSRRPIRWWNPAALLAIVALVATVVLVGLALDRTDKVNVADLAAVAIAAAVAATAVVVWARRRNTAAGNPADVTRAADVLADLVRRQWQDEARNRLLDDPEPIPVRWHLTADEAVMSTPRLISAATGFTFTGRSDDIATLVRDFRTLTRRRLVITGGAGMGKTTLAIQLLLQLLSTRATDQTSASGGEIVPVPVLLPVSGWDTDAHPRLQDWLAVRLATDYPALAAPQLGAGAAAALAEGGHILAVLDGLDEIPALARAQVIAALNASLTARDQLILTSRRAEFTTAVHDAGRPLTAAAVIVPKRLTPQAAADYLTACLPRLPDRGLDPHSGRTAIPHRPWLDPARRNPAWPVADPHRLCRFRGRPRPADRPFRCRRRRVAHSPAGPRHPRCHSRPPAQHRPRRPLPA